MKKILKVHQVNDYARYIGAAVLHPLVSVIHYDELEHCRHSLNNYDVYGMFLADETLEDLSYGQMQYVLNRHAPMCVAPGQIGGKTDEGIVTAMNDEQKTDGTRAKIAALVSNLTA